MADPIQRNIGGNVNSQGQGNCPLGDGVVANLENQNAGDDEPTSEAVFYSESSNTLSVYPIIDGITQVDRVQITKPSPLEKINSDTDGFEVDGKTITNLTVNRRKIEETIDGGILTTYETIQPPYVAGDRLVIAAIDDSDAFSVSKTDLNTAARRWENEEPLTKRFMIKEIKKDHFNCYAYVNNAVVETDDYIKVAKQDEVRGSYWESLSWNDGVGVVTYADASGDTDWATRVATRGVDIENHRIIPPWLPDNTILTANRMDIGTGVATVLWQDVTPSRAFSKVAT